tara:strand:+ start:218 stop:694 length:477 start_codon:yes stop_codon:yes gene_type:complete
MARRSKKSGRSVSYSPIASQDFREGMAYSILVSLVTIAINAYLLHYVLNLEKEKCECSKHWHRDYIKYFSIAAIAVSSLTIILVVSGLKLNRGFIAFMRVIRFLLGLATLVNMFVLYNYSTGLIEKECECSENTARTVMKYYSILLIAVLIISIIRFF